MIDIDSLSSELTQELALSPLEKALPPKLRYRYYQWLKRFREPKVNVPEVQNVVEKAFNHITAIKELKKNEVMASFYDTGFVRMDFGKDIDKKVKEAAMRWAKKKGLKAVEASLDKSDSVQSYVVYGSGQGLKGIPVKYVKLSI